MSLLPATTGVPVLLALDIKDPVLADRLVALLGGISGLRLVAPDELGLTPREQEVLTLLAEGASNKLIARRLGISVHTAKFHVGSLLNKFDAVGRTDAVAHAARLGVLQL